MLASCSQNELDTLFGPRSHQTFLQSTKKKESVLETLGSSTQMADLIFSSMSVYLRITRSIVVHHRPSCHSLMRQGASDKELLSSSLLLSSGVHQSRTCSFINQDMKGTANCPLELPMLMVCSFIISHIRQFPFNCSTEEGAVLVLPNGASRTDLRFRGELLEYARQHVVSWHEYVYRTLGLEVEAGPLYLITGFDKCDNWCLASYVNIPPNASVSLAFTPIRDSPGANILYSSHASGAISSRTFSPGDNHASQCAFIRGYKMMLSRSLTEKILSGPIKISDIVPSGTEVSTRAVSGIVSGMTAIGRWLSWMTGKSGGSGSTDNSDDVKIEGFPRPPEACSFATSIYSLTNFL